MWRILKVSRSGPKSERSLAYFCSSFSCSTLATLARKPQKIPNYLVLDNNGWLLFVLSSVWGGGDTKRSKEPALRTYSHMPKKRKTDNFEHEIVKILKSNVHQPTVVQSYDPNEMFLQLQLPLI